MTDLTAMDSLKTKLAIGICLGSSLLGLLTGCRCEALVLKETDLGGFYVHQAGSQARGQLHVPDTATNVSLGFHVTGLKGETNGVQDPNRVLHALASGELRLRLALLKPDGTNEFYRAEFSIGDGSLVANCGGSRLSAHFEPLFVFNGIQPLDNRAEYDLVGDATVSYHYGRNDSLLAKGKLVRGADYVVELTVLAPIAITNEFRLWHGSLCTSPSNRNVQ
jgi:hypothetical protein